MSLCFFVPLFLGVLGVSLYFSHLRYIVSGNEKQATLTGRQQRDGCWTVMLVADSTCDSRMDDGR